MNIYKEWSFKENPFQTSPLPPELAGNKLISGREQEIRKLTKRIYNQPQIPTIEGLNGIGKSSLINVSVFRAFKSYLENRDDSPLFIPCIKNFQIKENLEADEFLDEVFIEIAQTLIKHKEDLKTLKLNLPKNLKEIDNWLNSPYSKSYQGTVGALSFQAGAGKTLEANTAMGFEKNGFRRAVQNWLQGMFPNPNSGGIVCIIDNMELLEKSKLARKIIEELRDKLFSIQGIRWIMCGSHGIITSIVSSPRLEGLMHDPIQIKGIEKRYLADVFEKRINTYKKNQKYYLPITKQSFADLYEILKSNIRNTLKYANDYCEWVDDNNIKPTLKQEKESIFKKWLIEKSGRYLNDIKSQIKPRTLKLFKDAVDLGSGFALADYELFEYNSIQAMTNCIRSLESVNLIVSIIDENDSRRKSIQITSKGWFVSSAL